MLDHGRDAGRNQRRDHHVDPNPQCKSNPVAHDAVWRKPVFGSQKRVAKYFGCSLQRGQVGEFWIHPRRSQLSQFARFWSPISASEMIVIGQRYRDADVFANSITTGSIYREMSVAGLLRLITTHVCHSQFEICTRACNKRRPQSIHRSYRPPL